MTQIQQTRAGVVSQTLNYGYDGSGQRVKVTDSGGTRYFLYDGGMPVLELDANKKITTSYLYGADGVVYRRKHNAVAHWHFDEGNGTVAHDVDGGNTGTLSNVKAAKPPTWSFGCGLLFDGVGDLVKVPDSDALDLAGDKLTITAWVQPHSSQVGPLVKKINPTHGYRINITATGALRFVLRRYGQNKTVTSTTTVPLNKWTHVAVRYDGAQMRIFINGTIDTATTAATNANTPIATTAPVLIGGDTSRHHFHGYMDDVSIYNRALSDSKIADLVNDVDKRYEYHHVNALGSNIVSTDDNQNVLVRYEYDVFGAIRNETGTSDNTRKFTGKEFDADSNLYYYGARYYDPYIGRFTQRDPIGDGVNWYAYVANNPLAFVDPTGMRLLFNSERRLARVIFGRGIDLNSVTVRGGFVGWLMSAGTGARTIGNTIYIKKNISLRLMMHELTHVWQWQNDIFGPKPVMGVFALFEGAWAIFDHDAVYKQASGFPGVESTAVLVGDITEDYLLQRMKDLKSAGIIKFVNRVVPFLIVIQNSGGGGALVDYLNRFDPPDLMSALVSQQNSSQPLWEVLEQTVDPPKAELGQNFPNPAR